MIHTVKGFSIVDSTKIDFFFPEIPLFLYIPMNVGNLIQIDPISSYSFSKHSLDIWKFLVQQCWSLACKILCMIFLALKMSATFWWLVHSLVTLFLGIGMRIDLFQSCVHCWVFQICWYNDCKTLMTSSFRDLNSSAGMPSHPLASLTALLLKTHLTLHSRMSFYGWLTTPS